MSRKEILIIFLIICCLFSLQAVAAASDGNSADNVVLTTDSNVSAYSLPNTENQLRDGSDAGTFSDLQNELSLGGDIVLTKNYTYDRTKDDGLDNGISVPKTVNSITGIGKIVIDASQQARIFNIHSSHSVTLTGITFINANADGNGGSINSDGTLIISNCNFINNTASGHGGAVYLGSSDGDTIVNCNFEGNVAGGNGGAIDWYAGSSDGEIIGSTFTDNTAKRSGGAVHWSGHYGTIKDSKFTNNVATGDVINEIGGILGGGDGGAVLWVGSNGTIDNCIFIDNFAHYRGGAIFLHGNSTENCTNTTVSNSNFEDNIAGLNGGAIDWQKGAHDGKLVNSNFTRNTAWRSGGAVYWYGVNGTISYCNFDSNDAVGNVTQHDKGIIIYDNIGGHGGAVLWAGTLGDADNSNFTNNTACRYGGAVYLQSNSEGNCTNTTFIHCNFKDNEAGINGGAIDWHEGAHDGSVLYCDFTNNKAGSNGGAIFWSGHHGEIHYSNFTNNIAKGILTDEHGNKGDGGAIIWSGINGTVTYCRFVNNTADQRGGGVYLQNCTHGNCDNTTFSHSIFINNTAGLNGGAIDWHAGASHGNVSYCNFENNIANRSAGAIYWSGHNGTVEYSNFTFNKALGIAIGPMPNGTLTYGGDGGAIMWTGAIGSVENSLFSDNTAVKRGGAIFLQEGTTENCYNTTFSNSKFINNFAGTNGGAIDWHRGAANGTIEYCLFENNIANRSAGAVFWNGRNGTIIHSNFTQNEAKGIAWAISVRGENNTGGDGGAIMWSGSVGLVDDCRFIDNTAAERGGGIFLQGTEIEDCYNTTFKNSYFEGNVAGDEGGAINWDVGSQNGYVYNVEFVNNTAYTNGGAIHWNGYNGTIKSSTFRNNRATGDVRLYNMSLTLNDIEVYDDELPEPSLWTEGKLYVLVTNDAGKISKFGLYVTTNNGHYHSWTLLRETPEVEASPVDWAIDEFFGGDGGSIIWHGDVAHIDDCTFIESNSARRGGAVYMTGGDYVEFTRCSFENCTSGTNGGGLDWFAGANYGKVIDCNFTNTHAARSAGAIYYDGDNGEMRNIIIKNTTAYGGARTESEDGKVKYACWDLSHWDTNTTGGDGGAMMFTGDHITVCNVNFTDCTAAGRGGAIFVQDNHNVTIDSCIFENNHALGIANNTYNDPHDPSSGINHNLTGHGGAIAFDTGATETSIINSIFNNNTAKLYGGAVHYREGASEDKVINSAFNNNYADEDGGALFIDGNHCELRDSTFNHNYVGDDGGAIYWHGQGGIIDNINCTNNTGVSSHGNSKGGTICLTGNDISLSNSRFEDSYAKVTGGAMFVTGNNVNIVGTSFKNCSVSNSTGGALQLLGNNTQVRDCTFEDCHADTGGAIYTEGNYVKVINSKFTNNNVTEDGAAIYVFGDYSELHNSTFISNSAGDDGGAIYWEGDHGTIYNITCENNNGVSFNDSNSKGGTICLTGEDISISSSSFKNSSAGDDGGAIFISGNNVDIIGSDFEACNSSSEGGAIYVLGDGATISDCTFKNCNATQGGAIYVEGNGATISAEITDTHATGASSYGISIDNKLYKDNIKEIKYDIIDSIGLVATINGGNISIIIITDLNATLNDLYNAVDNILNDNGINTTNVTAALAIVSQLKANLTQLNATLPAGEDKNITLKLLSEIENIENELNKLIEISETLNVPGNILVDVDSMIVVVDGMTPGDISAQNITDLKSDLNNLYTAVDNMLNGTTFNSTNIESALKLINDLNNMLSQLNATLPDGNDKNTVMSLLYKVNEVKKDLNNLSDLVVVPEVLSSGGAIYVSGDMAVIENSLINDTDAVYGGGIYIAGDDVKVDGTEFINLYSVEDGGAIYITGQRGRLYNSKFINNTAGDDGGAINWDGNYGIIDNIVCENNRGISFNGSSSNGGTISLTGNDTSISKSSFSQSYALISGGAIFVTGNNVNITDSEFENCYVSMDIAETNKNYTNGGGAIYLFGDSSNVVNCNFDNSTGREGGAIYVQGNDVTIDKSRFTDSFALNGGAIYINGTHTVISNSAIDDSNATYSGGAVFISGIDADIINSSFSNTHAFGSEGNGGGAIYIEGENADVIGSNFTNTYANSNSHAKGGAMYITGANAEIADSKFTNAHSNLQGGAIYVNGTDTIINGSEFYNCMVDSLGSEGGAIYIHGQHTIVEDSNFANSSAVFRGGAIYIDGLNALVKDSNFTDSSVSGGKYNDQNPCGGAVYINENYATIEGSIFTHSTVSKDYGNGGAIFIQGNNAYVTASSVNGSYANCGGALYSTGSNSKVEDSNFTNNFAKLNGGALYWYGASNSKNNTVDGCIFTNNTANGYTTNTDLTRGGGAIFWSEQGRGGTVKNSKFYNNSVQSINKKKVDGGAILWDKSYNALVENCTFVGNFVTTDGDGGGTGASAVWAQGGAMYLRPMDDYTVRNCLFENCSSSKEAGALYIQTDKNAAKSLIENCTFINNVAYGEGTANINGGGAMQIKQAYNVKVKNVTFINNTANKGGALCVYDQVFYLVVDGANFTGNKANKGSAISTSVNFTLKNAVIIENRADTTKFDFTFNRENGGSIDILLEGADTHLNAMYIKHGSKGFTISCDNVTYWTDNNISTGKTAVKTGIVSSIAEGSVPEAGIATLVEIFDGDNKKLHEGIYATDADGKIHLNISDIVTEPYSLDNIYVNARLLNEDYYTMAKKTSRIQNVYVDASALDTIFHRNTTVTANITAPGNGTGQAARGTVSVYIDDVFKGNMTIENSKGSLENILTNVTADKFFEVGNHTIFLKYWGDAYFGEANKTISFNITKAQSNITLDYYDIGYDFHVTVTIVDEFNDVNYMDANGTVIIDVYNVGSTTVIKSIPVNIVNSTGFVKITELLPANYTLVYHYSGDKNYNASLNSTLAELHKKADAIVNITVNAYDIMVNETVYINITLIVPPKYEATGNVTLYLDNEKYILQLNNSRAYFNKTGLSEGVKIVTVCYDGSDLLIPTSSDATFRVLKYNTTLSVNTTNITHIQHEVINITLLNDTVGVVSVFINDDEYFARINNGTAILELPLLPVGEYNVTVVFPGDDKYNNNTSKSKFKVSRVTPDVNIEVENVTYGDSTRIVVSIIDCVEGNVTIKIDGTQYGNPKPIENGKVEFVVEYLTAGNYTLEAIYSGDINHTASSAEKDFAVYKANRTIVIEVQNITYGDIEHIKVYVNATGNVTIFVDGRNATIELNESDVPATILRAIINTISEYKGKAALDVYNLDVGKYPVDVVYNGNENYNKATARATFIVSQVNTNLVIDTHRVPVWNTEYINVTVRDSIGGIAVNATGKIKLYIDGVEQTADIVDGVARFNTAPSSVGQKVVWAFYDGDINYIGNRAITTFDVTQRNPHMNISAQNIIVGQNGNITVQLPENATGYVEIEVLGDNNYYCEVINGHAAVYPKNLKEGDYQVYVIYHGDQHDNYTSVIKETYFIVSKAKANVTIDVNDTVYDNAVNIVVYVDDGVEGNISIKLDSTDLGTYGIVDGKVNITIDNPGVGSYTVYAEYNGNHKYDVNKTESKGFTVDKATPVIIIDKVTVDSNTNATIVVRINETATGKINITVNGTKYNATIENGVATFTIDKLLAGKYNITAEYSGDNNYTSVTGKTLVDGLIVTKVSCYQINVTANDTEVDFNSTIIVKVPIDATGNVSIYVDDEFVGNATISQGIAQLNVTKPYGNHTINATFTDSKYGPRYAISDFWVFKHESPIVIDVNSILAGDVAYINVTAPSDNVTIEINGESYNRVKYENGIAQFVVSDLQFGNKTVVAIYGGSNKYLRNTTTANFTVDKRNSQVNVTAIGNSVGDNATISVKVQSNATGYVTVNVNGTNYTIKLNNVGEGSVKIAGLGNGTYYVYATYLGDDQYKPSENNTETFVMTKVQPNIIIDVKNVTYGDYTIIKISVPDASGNLTIRINNMDKGEFTLVNGKVEFDAGILGVENYTVYVSYKGDDKYAAGTADKDFNVTKAPPIITIVDSVSDVNTNATIVVRINSDASGTLNITVEGKNYTADILGGVAKFTVDKLPVNLYDIKANYSGDANYTSKFETLVNGLNVTKVGSYLMNVTAGDVGVGENTAVVVNVPLDAAGTVTVWVNGTKLTNTTHDGKAIFYINQTKEGRYVVNATLDDVKYANQTVETSYYVSRVDIPMTITVVDENSIYAGDTVKVIVTVPKDVTENVTIEINGIELTNVTVDGNAIFYVPAITYGNKTVVAAYAGDDKYLFNSTTANFTVNKRDSYVNVNVTDISVGETAVINVTVPANATGYAIVNINGTEYSINLTDGKGSVEVKDLEYGTYRLNVTYIGDDQYLSSENSTVEFTVSKLQPVFTVNGTDIIFGENELVTFETTENITGIVKIEIGGKNYTGIIYEGKGNVTVENLKVGGHDVTLYFDGNRKYLNATAYNTFDVGKATIPVVVIAQNITYGDKEIFAIYVNSTGKVNITIDNEVIYLNKDIDKKLIFELPGVLTVGNYTVNVDYSGNENYTRNSGSADFKVVKADPVITVEVQNITYGDVEHIIVHVNAEGNVTIKVNGTEETIILREDNNAVVILRGIIPSVTKFDGKAHEYLYNLNVGEYPVEVIYNGNDNYNKATVNALFFVNKDNTTVTVDVADIRVDGKEIINVTINNTNASGVVIINVDGVNYTRPLTDGATNLTLDKLSNGTHSVVVIYEGDYNFYGNWTSATFSVSKVKPDITLHVYNTTVGQIERITVDLPENATGFVVIDVEGTKYHVNITKGQQNVVLELDNLVNKTYDVTAVYSGDGYYDTGNDKANFNVSKVPSAINVTVSHDGIIANGSDMDITVKAPVDATGKVEIIVSDGLNDTSYTIYVNDGTGTLHIETPAIGIYNVTAKYLGDEKYIGSENKTKFEVYITGKELFVDTEPVTVANNESIEVFVSGNHTDKEVEIIVMDASGNIVSKQNATFGAYDVAGNQTIATLTLDKLPAGNYTVEAFYLENVGGKLIEHAGTGSFVVSKLNSTLTIGEITNITVGENVTIELVLDPTEATGNISVFVNGIEHITNATALKVVIPNLGEGEYFVHALYEGDHDHYASNATAEFKVSKVDTIIRVNATNITVGEKVLIEITSPEDLTNVVLVDVGGVGYYVNLTAGKGKLYIPNLASGNYNVTVRYMGDYKYGEAQNTTNFTVSKVTSSINVTAENITVGDKAVIFIETPQDLYGNVTVRVGGENYTVFVSGGKGTLVVPGLDVGEYVVNVTFDGSEKYEPVENSNIFNVNKVETTESDIKVINQGNGTVVVVVPNNATGNVTIKVDGKEFNATVVNGTAVVQLENVTPGTHEAEVIYSGDGNYEPITTTANVTAPKYDSQMNITVGEIKSGENGTVVVELPENATGVVTVSVDGKSYNATVVDGVAVVEVGNLTAGSKTVVVEYSGDGNYTSGYVVGNFTVEPAKVVPDVAVVDYGNGTVVVVVGDNATGNVTVKVGDKEFNATVVNGTAVVELGNLTPGVNAVEVIYSGDATHNSTVVNATVVGPKYDSPFEVIIPEAKEGEPTYVTVKVPQNATGNVTVTVDGKNYTAEVVDGTVVVDVGNLTAGSKSVIVEYHGDNNYANNYTVFNFAVEEAKAVPEMKVIDQGNGTVVVVVGDNATGNVTVTVDGKNYTAEVVDGTAVVELDNIAPGTHEVEVIYSGDSTHNATTTNANVTAPKYDSPFEVIIPEAKEGEPVNVTVKVPENATGVVTVSVDGKSYNATVVDGVAVVEVGNLTAGSKTVVVEYSGDDNYTSGYAVGNFTVEPAMIIPEVSVVDYGNGTVVVVVGDNATGNVTISIDGKNYTAEVVNGTAVVELGNLTPGVNAVEVIYSGDATHNSTVVNANVTGPKYDSPFEVIVPEAKEGEPVNVTVKVPENATGVVTVSVDGKSYNATVVDGVAVVEVGNLTAGSKTVVVEYSGDDNYTSGYAVGNFTVEPAKVVPDVSVVDYGNGTVVVVVGDNATGNVTITVDGKNYTAEVVNGAAVVELDNVAPGTHEVEVVYSGDGTHNATVTNANVTAPKYDSPMNITVGEIKSGENGTVVVNLPENAMGNVTVYIDGKNFTAEVVDGVAVVEVGNLTAGSKTVVVEYSGDGNYTSGYAVGNFTVEQSPVVPEFTVIDQGNGTVVVVVPKDATGNVTVTVDGKNFTAEVVNGTAVIVLDDVTPGTHEVDVVYSGDDNYEGVSTNTTVTAPKESTPISVSVDDIKVGENATVTVTVPVNATGDVTVTIDGKNYTAPIKDGKAVFEIANLTAGSKSVTVEYAGDNNYNSNYTISDFTVSKVTPDVNMSVAVDGDDAIIDVTVPVDATGQMLIDVDGVGYYVNITDGKGQLVIPDMAGGEHVVVVTYPGDDKYVPSDAVKSSFVISDVPSSVEVKVDNITYGEDAVIEITGPEDATGNVTVTIDGKNYTAEMSNGKATVVVHGLEAGNHTVEVAYSGDDKYAPNSTSAVLDVSKDAIGPDDIKVIDQGNGTVVVVVPEDATGNITVNVDGKNYTAPIVNGTAVVQLDGVAPGEHTVDVIYSGDGNYDGVSTNATVSAPKEQAPISVSVDDIKVGENATVTVTVPVNATGDVTVTVNGKNYTAPIEGGKAVFEIANLTAGSKSITVEYAGDNTYNSNYTISDFTVSKVTPDVNMNVATDGDKAIIDVTVPVDATGQMLIDVDGVGYYVNITDGKGQLVIPDMAGGEHDVVATYPGDDKYVPSDAVKSSFVISDVPSSVEVKVDNITYGEDAVVEVTGPKDAAGNVTVTIDGKNYTAEMSNGKATVVVHGLEAGNHTVEVAYSGDDKYAPNSTSTVLDVSKDAIGPDDIKVIDQGNGTVVVVVPEDATGNITVNVDGKNYTAEIVNGTAVVQLDGVAPGEHSVDVIYSGDGNYDGVSTNAAVTAPKEQAPISVSVDDINVGDKAVITVTLPDDAEGTVTLEIDGKNYTATVEEGKAVFEIENLTAGTKTFVVEYAGDDKYLSNHTTDAITVSKCDAPITVEINDTEAGDNVTVVVNLPKDATGQVLIDIDGVGYYVNVTNGVGIAQIPRIPAGSHEVNVTYTGDDKYGLSSTKSSFNVTKLESFVIPEANDIYVGEDEMITVVVPSDATGTVTVVIGGKAYEFNLDTGVLNVPDTEEVYTIAVEKGTGKLVISGLPEGDYVVSVKYNGDGRYLPSVNSTNFKVIKSTTPVEIDDLGNGTMVVSVPEGAAGEVRVTIDNETYIAEVIDGVAVVNLNDTTPGRHEIVVEYTGDETHGPQRKESVVIIPKYNTPISVDIGDSEVGEPTIITVTVPENTTGNVTIEIDGIEYTAVIKGGKATFKIDDLTSGNKTIVVKYVGDQYYNENVTSSQFVVSKKESEINASSIDISAGKNEIITVNVPSDATGKVLVKINGVGYYADIINGKAKVIIPDLPAGKYTATVYYQGDDKYLPSDNVTTTFTVSKSNAPISASADDIDEGEDATVVVKLPKDATGTVTITIDGKQYTTNVKDGKAVFVIPGLTRGKYQITANYSGDGKYDPNGTIISIEVHYNETPKPHPHPQPQPHRDDGNDNYVKEGVSLTDYPTANPIWILLLVLLTVVSTQIRRFRKN